MFGFTTDAKMLEFINKNIGMIIISNQKSNVWKFDPIFMQQFDFLSDKSGFCQEIRKMMNLNGLSSLHITAKFFI